MQQALQYLIGKIASFFGLLNELPLASGVSVAVFLFALFVIGALIRNFLFSAR